MSIRFAKGETPIVVKGEGVEYSAGHLSLIGRKSMPGIVTRVKNYLKDSFDFDSDNPDVSNLDAFGIANLLLGDESVIILTCDYTDKLQPGDLLEWDEDFFEKAFNTALDANPRYKPRAADASDTGQAQPETHDEKGQPLAEDKTPKNLIHPEAYQRYLAGYQFNPFADPELEKGKPKEPPTLMEVVGKLRWQTSEEAEMHYVSELLGELIGVSYVPLYPDAPGEWPDWYLDSVVSHTRHKQMLRFKQKQEADRVKKKSQMPEMPKAQQEKSMLREKDWFSRNFPKPDPVKK